jgi:hypothetical protein
MKKVLPIIMFVFITNSIAKAETNTAQTKELLKNFCGCFEVEFKYKETFSPLKDYKLKETYNNEALEWVSYEPQQDGSIKMQHILIVDNDMIVKHWREDWSYENKDLYKYDKDYHWTKTSLNPEKVKGTWTQKVYEVDDRPQYEGNATFAYFDDKILWQSTVDAPLPRREYSKRNDYNVLNRGNRLYISPTGYLHEQDNKKIKRTTNISDTIVAEEKGYNTYKKVEESKCQIGINWWEKNKIFWMDVRSVWDELLPSLNDLTIQHTVEDKKLHERLFAMNQEFIEAKKYDSKKAKEAILAAIKKHLVTK